MRGPTGRVRRRSDQATCNTFNADFPIGSSTTWRHGPNAFWERQGIAKCWAEPERRRWVTESHPPRRVPQLAALNTSKPPPNRDCDADLELETVVLRLPADPQASPPSCLARQTVDHRCPASVAAAARRSPYSCARAEDRVGYDDASAR